MAVPSLEALLESDVEVVAVVTNPDRPAGRGMAVQAPPVKETALAAGVEVFQPERVRDPEVSEWLARRAPDVCTVVAYGKILPGDLLAVPRLGFVNVHFSILPAYRGAAPVQRALMDGVEETGVSIMVLTEGMDEGPALAVERTPVGGDETAGEVGERLAKMGGPLLAATLTSYAAGALEPQEQDAAAATYAPKITTSEARIDWGKPAARIKDQVRGLNPVPGAWTTLRGKRLKVLRLAVSADPLEPGELRIAGDELLAGAGEGSAALLDVQPEGKRRMGGGELARGLRLEPGERLE